MTAWETQTVSKTYGTEALLQTNFFSKMMKINTNFMSYKKMNTFHRMELKFWPRFLNDVQYSGGGGDPV